MQFTVFHVCGTIYETGGKVGKHNPTSLKPSLVFPLQNVFNRFNTTETLRFQLWEFQKRSRFQTDAFLTHFTDTGKPIQL